MFCEFLLFNVSVQSNVQNIDYFSDLFSIKLQSNVWVDEWILFGYIIICKLYDVVCGEKQIFFCIDVKVKILMSYVVWKVNVQYNFFLC